MTSYIWGMKFRTCFPLITHAAWSKRTRYPFVISTAWFKLTHLSHVVHTAWITSAHFPLAIHAGLAQLTSCLPDIRTRTGIDTHWYWCWHHLVLKTTVVIRVILRRTYNFAPVISRDDPSTHERHSTAIRFWPVRRLNLLQRACSRSENAVFNFWCACSASVFASDGRFQKKKCRVKTKHMRERNCERAKRR